MTEHAQAPRTWRDEFPDFPLETLPGDLPAGFVDQSWHNDACPSFLHEPTGLALYCDHPEPGAREYGPDTPRFLLLQYVRDTRVGPDWYAPGEGRAICQAETWAGMRSVLVGLIDLKAREADPVADCSPGVAELVRHYERWIAAQGLPSRSAEELLHESITPEQRAWLSAFCILWDAAEEGGAA